MPSTSPVHLAPSPSRAPDTWSMIITYDNSTWRRKKNLTPPPTERESKMLSRQQKQGGRRTNGFFRNGWGTGGGWLNNPWGVKMWASGFYVSPTAIETSSALSDSLGEHENLQLTWNCCVFCIWPRKDSGSGPQPHRLLFSVSSPLSFSFSRGASTSHLHLQLIYWQSGPNFNPRPPDPCSFCDLWGCDGTTKLSQRTNDIWRQHLSQRIAPAHPTPSPAPDTATEVWTFN